MGGINLAPGEQWSQRIVQAIRQLMQGRNNATGSVTLTASATTTIVEAPNCSAESEVFLQALTAHAAAEVGNGTIYISAIANGSFTITHASNSQVDRTFSWVALG